MTFTQKVQGAISSVIMKVNQQTNKVTHFKIKIILKANRLKKWPIPIAIKMVNIGLADILRPLV